MLTEFFLPLIAERCGARRQHREGAVCPAVTVWFAAGLVIVGATGAGFHRQCRALLVTVPAVLLTTTAKVAPLSAVVVVGVV